MPAPMRSDSTSIAQASGSSSSMSRDKLPTSCQIMWTKSACSLTIRSAKFRMRLNLCEPSYIQLHGDEPAEFLSELPAEIKIIRAYRCGPSGLAPLARYLDQCQSLGRMPDAILLDADAAGAFGGTGQAADWSLIANQRAMLGVTPLILAGGLTPTMLARRSQPFAPTPSMWPAASSATRPEGSRINEAVHRTPLASLRIWHVVVFISLREMILPKPSDIAYTTFAACEKRAQETTIKVWHK